jgi:hypothetical protein
LKTFETRQCIVRDGATRSGTMIVAFNKNRLTDVCYSNSPDYNPSLCDFDLIASEIFKEDETWVNRGLVNEVMDLLAKLHGWVAKLTQKYLQCNRYGKVSALSLQLQNLMTIDPKKSKTVTSRGGYSVTRPDQSLIASQVKTRFIPLHEQRAIKASEKLNTAIQNLGRK